MGTVLSKPASPDSSDNASRAAYPTKPSDKPKSWLNRMMAVIRPKIGRALQVVGAWLIPASAAAQKWGYVATLGACGVALVCILVGGQWVPVALAILTYALPTSVGLALLRVLGLAIGEWLQVAGELISEPITPDPFKTADEIETMGVKRGDLIEVHCPKHVWMSEGVGRKKGHFQHWAVVVDILPDGGILCIDVRMNHNGDGIRRGPRNLREIVRSADCYTGDKYRVNNLLDGKPGIVVHSPERIIEEARKYGGVGEIYDGVEVLVPYRFWYENGQYFALMCRYGPEVAKDYQLEQIFMAMDRNFVPVIAGFGVLCGVVATMALASTGPLGAIVVLGSNAVILAMFSTAIATKRMWMPRNLSCLFKLNKKRYRF